MREWMDGLMEALPVSLMPYLIFGAGLLITGFCFAMAYFLNRK